MTSLSQVEGELLVQRLGGGRFIGYLPTPRPAATPCASSAATQPYSNGESACFYRRHSMGCHWCAARFISRHFITDIFRYFNGIKCHKHCHNRHKQCCFA